MTTVGSSPCHSLTLRVAGYDGGTGVSWGGVFYGPTTLAIVCSTSVAAAWLHSPRLISQDRPHSRYGVDLEWAVTDFLALTE